MYTRCGKIRQPVHVKDLLTKCKKDHNHGEVIRIPTWYFWKFVQSQITFDESSPKTDYVIFFMSIVKCQQNCIYWGCGYVFSCMMGIWKVLLHQWWLWGPAAAIRWRNHRRFVAADHWRRAEGGRGGLIMPKRGLIPTICLLSTVYTFSLRLLTVYSKVHCTGAREGVNSKFTKKCNVWDYKESWGGVTTSSHKCFLISVWPPSECKRTKYYNMERSRKDEKSITPPPLKIGY